MKRTNNATVEVKEIRTKAYFVQEKNTYSLAKLVDYDKPTTYDQICHVQTLVYYHDIEVKIYDNRATMCDLITELNLNVKTGKIKRRFEKYGRPYICKDGVMRFFTREMKFLYNSKRYELAEFEYQNVINCNNFKEINRALKEMYETRDYSNKHNMFVNNTASRKEDFIQPEQLQPIIAPEELPIIKKPETRICEEKPVETPLVKKEASQIIQTPVIEEVAVTQEENVDALFESHLDEHYASPILESHEEDTLNNEPEPQNTQDVNVCELLLSDAIYGKTRQEKFCFSYNMINKEVVRHDMEPRQTMNDFIKKFISHREQGSELKLFISNTCRKLASDSTLSELRNSVTYVLNVEIYDKQQADIKAILKLFK